MSYSVQYRRNVFERETQERESLLTTEGARAAKSKCIIPPNLTNSKNPKEKMNAVIRETHLSALMRYDELLLIFCVLSYRSIHVTPISKSMIALNGMIKYEKRIRLE